MPPVGVRVRFSFRVAGATFLGGNCPRTSYIDLNKNMCICVSACKHCECVYRSVILSVSLHKISK